MKRVLQVNKDLLFNVLFSLMFCLVIIPSNLKSIIIGVLSAFVIYNSISKRNKLNKKFLVLNASTFLVIGLTLIYSNNLKYGLDTLGKMSSLLVFPLLFSLMSKSEIANIFKNLRFFMWLYIISVCLFNIVPFTYYLLTQDTLTELVKHYPLVIEIDFGKFNLHAIYISMHICVALIFSIYLIRSNSSKTVKLILVLLITSLIIFLIIYLRKGPVIALVITLIAWSVLEYRKYLKYNLLVVFLLISLISLMPKTRSRFLELVNIEYDASKNQNSTNIRYTIYKNAAQLIKQEPLLGYGIGDFNDRLKESYAKNATYLLNKTYNSHNQFLSFLLMGGICILFVFLIMFGVNFVQSINQNNILLTLLLVFYGVMMFFENILEREDGVIFVAFFINLFAIKNYYKIGK
jgi:O-antigen ligase